MKDCACKGIRSCLKCEPKGLQKNKNNEKNELLEYFYCEKCTNKAYSVDKLASHKCDKNEIPSNNNDILMIDGVFLQENIITPEEENLIVQSIDNHTWMDSQSGRRKQDFGPKINFKKKKINFDPFQGLPEIDIKILDKIKNERIIKTDENERFEWSNVDAFTPERCDNILRNFKTVEVCHLEYLPERGSSIDPHFDDFWIWGERLVTLNLLSSTVITLSYENILIRVQLPARSILVLYGDARSKFKHAIERSHVKSRRLAITYRELPKGFLKKSSEDYIKFGQHFMYKSNNFIPYEVKI